MPWENRRAFTIIELLVVIAIIALLVAVLLPGLGAAKESARVSACAARQRQIMTAFFTYASERKDRLPHAVSLDPATPYKDWSGFLHDLIGNDPVFACPDDSLPRDPSITAPRSYYVNDSKWTYFGNGYRGPWPKYNLGAPSTVDVADGVDDVARLADVPPHVMIIGERYNQWYAYAGPAFTSYVGNWSYFGMEGVASTDHYDGAGGNYGYSDGHVRYVREAVYLPWRADTDYGGDKGDPWKWRR